MPRRKRACPQGEVFHVLNRAEARLPNFEKPEDYDPFLRVIDETWKIVPLPIYAMFLMPKSKSFPIQSDERLLVAMRYVERNPVRADFVELAEVWVNKAESEAELSALRHCIQRGLPFGDDRWVSSSAVRLSLESATRPRRRPRTTSCPAFPSSTQPD
ncbi:MAG: hypothetical protein NT069_11765 [Planctomycetota bacterium]|nr:hypothetical protein [Planctomycetota bacterium]